MLKIKNDGNHPWFISTNVPTEISTERLVAPTSPGQPEQLEVGETLVIRSDVEVEVSLSRDTITVKHV